MDAANQMIPAPVPSSHVNDEEQKRYYHGFTLAMAMAAITAVELVVIYLPWATWLIYTLVVVLSVVKFIGVVTWFMHLIYDKVLLTLLFVTGMVLAVGTVAALLFLFSPQDAIPLEPAWFPGF
jgi:cytochrome c oxidase subunit 4